MVPVSQLQLWSVFLSTARLPPSSICRSLTPSLPQLRGCSRHYHSCYAHLFVYSRYCGEMLPQEESEIPATDRSDRTQPEAFIQAEVRENHMDHYNEVLTAI